MPYKVGYNKELNYIEAKIEGAFSLSILKELAADVAKIIEKYGCERILNDMRLAKLAQGVFDIYDMPKVARNAGVEINCKRALVVRDQSSGFDFLETVFINQGHRVKLFTDIEEAKSWLLE